MPGSVGSLRAADALDTFAGTSFKASPQSAALQTSVSVVERTNADNDAADSESRTLQTKTYLDGSYKG